MSTDKKRRQVMANKNRTLYFNKNNPRRHFLKNVAAASVLGSGAVAMNGKLGLMGSALAASSDYAGLTDYKALVCVFLYGGSDSFNMFVPTEEGLYNNYAQSRGSLSMARESLLMPATPSGFGFNPAMGNMMAQYDAGNLAVVSNVGNLISPVSKAEYLAESNQIPDNLFAHNHQQEQWLKGFSSSPTSLVSSGWGGRMADLLRSANTNNTLPPTFSMGGSNYWLPGNVSTPINLNVNTGIETISFMNQGKGRESETRADLLSRILAMPQEGILQEQAALAMGRGISSADAILAALGTSDTIQASYDASSDLAKQLRLVARLIAAQQNLGMQRQIFFVGLGGWDTHDNQAGRLQGLLSNLDRSLSDFNNALVELNQQDSVTTFTASDFGRTLTVNGDGSDHGWGGHYMVMGGAVDGGKLYGEMPSFITGSDDDAGDKGRVIPSLSINQFGASMGSWLGLSDGDIADVFPDLSNFGSDWRTGLNLFA